MGTELDIEANTAGTTTIAITAWGVMRRDSYKYLVLETYYI